MNAGRWWALFSLHLTVLGFSTSCAQPRHDPPKPLAHAAIANIQIAQLDYSGNARFALCSVPDCPLPTRKTLAVIGEAPLALQPIVETPTPVAETPASLAMRSTAEAEPVTPPSQPETAPTQAVDPTTPTGEPQGLPVTNQKTADELFPIVHVRFHTGSSHLTDDAKTQLDGLVAEAARAERIDVRGRTDEIGSVATNEALARSRALTVRDYLSRQLPGDTPIRVRSKGACCYVASNDTPEGRAANRRVEIQLEFRVQETLSNGLDQHS